jgi:very-short-patch-repair endonuclease
MTKRARALRQSVSPIERKLWRALRADQLGVSFRRQHPIGRYVLDFYCPSSGLAIEVDGDDHAARLSRDAARTRFLASRGIHVIRFTNRDVWRNLEAVCEAIIMELARLKSWPPPGLAGAKPTSPFQREVKLPERDNLPPLQGGG